MNPIEPSEIDVSAIHYIEGSSFEYYPIQGVDVVDFSLGDRHECRDGSVPVDHRVEQIGMESELRCDIVQTFPESQLDETVQSN